jgi:hypothetical protein
VARRSSGGDASMSFFFTSTSCCSGLRRPPWKIHHRSQGEGAEIEVPAGCEHVGSGALRATLAGVLGRPWELPVSL